MRHIKNATVFSESDFTELWKALKYKSIWFWLADFFFSEKLFFLLFHVLTVNASTFQVKSWKSPECCCSTSCSPQASDSSTQGKPCTGDDYRQNFIIIMNVQKSELDPQKSDLVFFPPQASEFFLKILFFPANSLTSENCFLNQKLRKKILNWMYKKKSTCCFLLPTFCCEHVDDFISSINSLFSILHQISSQVGTTV